MKRLRLTTQLVLLMTSLVFAQDKPAYQLFDHQGKLANYDQMIIDLANSDTVFFGGLTR